MHSSKHVVLVGSRQPKLVGGFFASRSAEIARTPQRRTRDRGARRGRECPCGHVDARGMDGLVAERRDQRSAFSARVDRVVVERAARRDRPAPPVRRGALARGRPARIHVIPARLRARGHRAGTRQRQRERREHRRESRLIRYPPAHRHHSQPHVAHGRRLTPPPIVPGFRIAGCCGDRRRLRRGMDRRTCLPKMPSFARAHAIARGVQAENAMGRRARP